MRILFQTYSLAFQSPGGGERVMLELEAALRRRGHTVELFDPWLHDPADFDLLHYFSFLESSRWREFRGLYPRLPLVVTPTLSLSQSFSARLGRLRERWLSRSPANRFLNAAYPDLFLPATQREAQQLVRELRVPDEKLFLLPNGVAERVYSGEPELFRAFSGIKAKFALHVGRFHPVKRQAFLIEALGGSELECVFIGDPDSSHPGYFDECRKAAARFRNIHFFSGINNEDPRLASAYAAAAVFALPSEFETFGMAPLEAATAGCRLVLSNGMADPGIFGPSAKLLPVKEPSHWREELLSAASMGRLPAGEVQDLRSRFTWDSIAALLDAQYSALLSRGENAVAHAKSGLLHKRVSNRGNQHAEQQKEHISKRPEPRP